MVPQRYCASFLPRHTNVADYCLKCFGNDSWRAKAANEDPDLLDILFIEILEFNPCFLKVIFTDPDAA
jgi:hypothetical protein